MWEFCVRPAAMNSPQRAVAALDSPTRNCWSLTEESSSGSSSSFHQQKRTAMDPPHQQKREARTDPPQRAGIELPQRPAAVEDPQKRVVTDVPQSRPPQIVLPRTAMDIQKEKEDKEAMRRWRQQGILAGAARFAELEQALQEIRVNALQVTAWCILSSVVWRFRSCSSGVHCSDFCSDGRVNGHRFSKPHITGIVKLHATSAEVYILGIVVLLQELLFFFRILGPSECYMKALNLLLAYYTVSPQQDRYSVSDQSLNWNWWRALVGVTTLVGNAVGMRVMRELCKKMRSETVLIGKERKLGDRGGGGGDVSAPKRRRIGTPSEPKVPATVATAADASVGGSPTGVNLGDSWCLHWWAWTDACETTAKHAALSIWWRTRHFDWNTGKESGGNLLYKILAASVYSVSDSFEKKKHTSLRSPRVADDCV